MTLVGNPSGCLLDKSCVTSSTLNIRMGTPTLQPDFVIFIKYMRHESNGYIGRYFIAG